MRERPKALLSVNGRALIDRQLSALHAHDIYDITIVSGYQHDRLRAHVGRRARFVENCDYVTTAGELLIEEIDLLITAGDTKAWAPKAFDALAQHWPVLAVETGGVPWIEIDVPADLIRAEHEIAPALAGLAVGAAA